MIRINGIVAGDLLMKEFFLKEKEGLGIEKLQKTDLQLLCKLYALTSNDYLFLIPIIYRYVKGKVCSNGKKNE